MKTTSAKEKSGVFVIKDSESEQVLLIRIDQETLPSHFTVGDKQNIIALPAPAPTAPAPVVSKQ